MHKPEWLSEGVESLPGEWAGRGGRPFDVVVVGSGYGGAVAAARFAACREGNRDLDVCVLERGREHLPGTFPNNFSELPGHVRFSRPDDPVAKGRAEGLFDLRVGEDVTVLVASGLGGGSLINAGVAEQAEPDVFADASWPPAIQRDWEGPKPAFRRYYARALQMLAARPARAAHLAKHQRFMEFAAERNLDARPARVTIAFRDRQPNAQGVNQSACVNCGDCATGCNFNAKNTLSTNYLAAARRCHARIYTGATVLHLEPEPMSAPGRQIWRIFYEPTVEHRPVQRAAPRFIRAKHVVLAAGSFGSTEILMRSTIRNPSFTLSHRLGSRFSTNGDMISGVYDQDDPVNAAPLESQPLRRRNVGPTITGIGRSNGSRDARVVVEELAIPGALRRVFEEVLTTSALLDRLGTRDRAPHFPWDADPAAVDAVAVGHTQVFAAMGNDGAGGNLELVPGWDRDDNEGRVRDGAIRVNWPRAAIHDVFARQDALLSGCSGAGGRYLRNPLWQPLPPGLSSQLSGELPTGLLFSVHPLGGCPMGRDAEQGVVNHMGQVYSGRTGTDIHPGLLVLDGSIVPTALGINPLLTITALAERAAEHYINLQGWAAAARAPQALPALPAISEPVHAQAVPTSLRFSERMSGTLRFAADGRDRAATMTLVFQAVPDVPAFLANPQRELRIQEGTLDVRGLGPEGSIATARITGRVRLLTRGVTTSHGRVWRALCSYFVKRAATDLWETIGEKTAALLRRMLGVPARHNEQPQTLRQLFDGYVALASHVGEVRRLSYEFDVQRGTASAELLAALGGEDRLIGEKVLEYSPDSNPWRQLSQLELHDEQRRAVSGRLNVDLEYFFKRFASQLQIERQRDLPMATMDLASLALFLVRILIKIHFWSFRLPNYQPYDPRRDERRMPGPLFGLLTERHIVGYPATPRDAGMFLPVTRYRSGRTGAREPVLLIHGLGSGGIQFATRLVRPNLAEYLAWSGFDVWVAELRTSIALPSSLQQWTLDDVARGDIPRIVDFILEETRARQVSVVAHCIGSAMFCTAVLGGRLQHSSGESKIRRAALLQVGPLITLSRNTALRTLVLRPLRRYMPEGHVDFSVDDRADWRQGLVDRLLNTYPYPADEAKHHKLSVFGSNTHIANCNRATAIDGRMFQHVNVSDRMLEGLGEVLGHSSVTVWEQTLQYGLRDRLTDWDGRNSYVTAANVRRHMAFPVAFLHGEHNDVFDPLTSWRSRELLTRLNPASGARIRILEGYGHLDPLIGRRAYHDVFPHIAGFLRTGDMAETLHARHSVEPTPGIYLRRPLVGPILGWVRQEGDVWTARVWCRLDDLRSPVSYVYALIYRDGVLEHEMLVPADSAGGGHGLSAGPLDTTLWIDVPLGRLAGEYCVTLVSAHASEGEQVPDEQLEAERDAGKTVSSSLPHIACDPSRPPQAWRSFDGQLLSPVADFVRAEHEARAAERGANTRDRRVADPGYEDKIDSVHVHIGNMPTLTFAFGSCRYPGQMMDRERADAVFGELRQMLDQQDRVHAPSALLLVGDQIYADATAGAFDPKNRRERFYEAYREAFTAPNARSVLSRIPVYMMLDDHEVGDDWHPQDWLEPRDARQRLEGLEAFRRYQWIHSPRTGAARHADRLDYSFEHNGFPFFVCDTRSQRDGARSILGDAQFASLQEWLIDLIGDPRPKFVVSPSVVVPFVGGATRAGYHGRSDGWDGFQAQLTELFSLICHRGIENVIFLCGDSHISMCTEITFVQNGAPMALRAYCVVASPIYAPYPFANATADEFLDSNSGTPLPLAGPVAASMHYRRLASVRANGLSLVSVTAQGLDVTLAGHQLPTLPLAAPLIPARESVSAGRTLVRLDA